MKDVLVTDLGVQKVVTKQKPLPIKYNFTEKTKSLIAVFQQPESLR